MRHRSRFATVLSLGCLAAALAHCGMGTTGGFDDTRRTDASDARTDGNPSDARLDGGGTDASMDARTDARADAADARADVRSDTATDTARTEVGPRPDTGVGGACGDPCMNNDECASRCGAMTGGVFCCSYSSSDPSTPGTCYFSASPMCGGTPPMGGDPSDTEAGAGGDASDDAGGLDDAAGLEI